MEGNIKKSVISNDESSPTDVDRKDENTSPDPQSSDVSGQIEDFTLEDIEIIESKVFA
ncbi:MAG: TglA family RiPP precursor [Sedimenticola sp.]